MDSTRITSIPKDSIWSAVPPVEYIFTPRACNFSAIGSNPFLSKTEIKADFMWIVFFIDAELCAKIAIFKRK
jgi:hypothetical protein